MMNIIFFLLRLAGLLAMLAAPVAAMADCTVQNGWNNKPLTYNFPSTILVQEDASVGSVLFEEKTTNYYPGELFASCSGTFTLGVKYTNGWKADSNGIAQTNVPGVGIRIWWEAAAGEMLVPTDPYETVTGNKNFAWESGQPSWRIQLIKTGKIIGGRLQTGSYTVFGVGNKLITSLNIGGGGNIMQTGCEVTTPDITVPLGDHQKSEFNGPGSATDWKVFYIYLNCEVGARVSMTVDATADDSGTQGVMKLDSGTETAGGIGVQLWSGVYGAEGAVELGKLTFYNSALSGGSNNLKFQARYYQTGQTVTAGTANATATFTMTYR